MSVPESGECPTTLPGQACPATTPPPNLQTMRFGRTPSRHVEVITIESSDSSSDDDHTTIEWEGSSSSSDFGTTHQKSGQKLPGQGQGDAQDHPHKDLHQWLQQDHNWFIPR